MLMVIMAVAGDVDSDEVPKPDGLQLGRRAGQEPPARDLPEPVLLGPQAHILDRGSERVDVDAQGGDLTRRCTERPRRCAGGPAGGAAQVSSPLLLRDSRLEGALAGPPEGLEVAEHRSDLVVAELVAKGGHAALKARDVERGAALLHDLEQEPVAVMPGVAGSIVRWRGVAPVRTDRLPLRLPFAARAMAGGAVHGVEPSALVHDGVVRIERCSTGGREHEDQNPEE